MVLLVFVHLWYESLGAGWDAVDLSADRRDSLGAPHHPPRHALTPLGGRLLTMTCLCFEHQGTWSHWAASLWVGRPQGFEPLRASVTELLLHMAAPRTCLGAGDHLGLDPHLQQSGNVRLAAVGGVCCSAPLCARLAPALVRRPAEQLRSTSEPS